MNTTKSFAMDIMITESTEGDDRLLLDIPMTELYALTPAANTGSIDPEAGRLTMRQAMGFAPIMPPEQSKIVREVVEVLEGVTVSGIINLAKRYQNKEPLTPEEEARIEKMRAMHLN